MRSFLVTGASSGLGRGLVRALLARGDRVWAVARRDGLLEELSRECASPQLGITAADVSNHADVRRALDDMGRVGFIPDVVILNAAINPERFGGPFDIDTFSEVLQVNTVGALVWVHELLPAFRSRRAGQFVAISSLAAYRGDARWVAYCASKAALTRAFEALRGRHAGEGIAFTTVHFGAVDTGMGAGTRSPFRLSEQQAVARVLALADRRVASVTVPRLLRAIVEMLRLLPDPLFSRLVLARFGAPGTASARRDRSGPDPKHHAK